MSEPEYEVAWSGALEASGKAPGLSTYRGNSPLGNREALPDPVKAGDAKLVNQAINKTLRVNGLRREKIIAYRRDCHYSPLQIARYLKLTLAEVHYVLKDAGLETVKVQRVRKTSHSTKERERDAAIRRAVENGVPIRLIAEQHQLPFDRVRLIASSMGKGRAA